MSKTKIKKVVYTAVTGNYDLLHDFTYIDTSYDYICFSNDIDAKRIGHWEIRPIPFSHKDAKRVACYAKMHPHIYLNEYDFCIWVDANNDIKDEYIYTQGNKLFEENVEAAHIKHPLRDCIYDEIFACMYVGVEKTTILFQTYMFLMAQHFPPHAGLYELNLIYWNHHSPTMIKVLDDLWNRYAEGPRRDQLSLNYIYWKWNIKAALFFPEGEHMKNSNHIAHKDHLKDKRKHISISNLRMNLWKIRFCKLLLIIFRQLYGLSGNNKC